MACRSHSTEATATWPIPGWRTSFGTSGQVRAGCSRRSSSRTATRPRSPPLERRHPRRDFAWLARPCLQYEHAPPSRHSMRLTILGAGSSHGTPVIACDCATCTSEDPRDRRTRASALVEVGARSFLIDTGPELRLQAVRENVRRVDAVLYTHYHADHVHGLDDLKAFNAVLGGPLPCYGNASTGDVLLD